MEIVRGELPVYELSINEAITESNDRKKPVLAIFTAKWCSHCRILKNEISDNKNNFENYIVCYIDYDTNKDLAKKYNVSTIPNSIILDQSIEKKRKVGFFGIKEYMNWIRK